MGLFDELESRCEEIAGRAGIPPEQVRSMSSMLQQKMGDGTDHMEALEAVAREHGVPVDKVQEVLSHCGGVDGLKNAMGSLGGLGNLAGGFFKS
jgi:hypothetical protein